MNDEQLNALALVICAAIDEGDSCAGEPCETCRRTAQTAEQFIREQLNQ